MKRNLNQPQELEKFLMAMTGHDLRKVVVSVGAVLDTYMKEVNEHYIQTGEAPYIAERVVNIKTAGSDMLLCIDEILAVLDKNSIANAPFKNIATQLNEHYPAGTGHPLYVAANGQYVRELTDLAASQWQM